MAEFEKKCSCGCKETNWRLGLFGFFLWYFTDAGSWWFRIGTPWKTLSISSADGFNIMDSTLFNKKEDK